jgi:hypothetical protein
MASYADVQYCIYADIVGGSKKVRNYDSVIYGWSLINKEKIYIFLFFMSIAQLIKSPLKDLN